jgi:hypothetical protein
VSRARLRAAQAVPPVPADLLLRSVPPPDVQIRGADLVALLGPAYQRLAGQDVPLGLDEQVPGEQLGQD